MQALATFTEWARELWYRARSGPDFRETLANWREQLLGTEEKVQRAKKISVIGGPIALVLAALIAWLIFRPVPQPDYRTASIKSIFNYTLLTDEFNKLSIEKRLELIAQLVDRLKGMSAGESVMLAAFASGIAGEARKHIEENAARMAIDLWDKHAREYAGVPEADRPAHLDKTYVEFVRTMEAVSGQPSNKSDSEHLADARRQAERDKEAASSGKFNPPAEALGGMFLFLRDNVGGHAAPEQKSRGQLMMRDMVRHFRGQNVGGGR